MKAESMLSRGGPVARSLRITGSTHATVAATSAAISINGMIAVRVLGLDGQVAVLGVIFATMAACTAAISADVLGRSSRTIADLRSIGASRLGISSALFWNMFVYGAAASALGAGVGLSIASALNGGAMGTGALFDFAGVVAASIIAVAAGSYAGGRATWRS